jgi:pyridoxamine 5'-phosphate oxidase
MQPIADLRKEYTKASLDVSNVSDDPIIQFNKWFQEAIQAEVPEPNAMILATVNAEGRPSARVMLLKGVENNKFLFFTNYQSDKGKALENNAACALTFFWPQLERQIRIEGVVNRIDEKRSEVYFQSRPRLSQIGAWASPQSTMIPNREILEERFRQMEQKFAGQEVLPKPKQWGGFEVEPLKIEFWQGRASRLHDRILFTFVDGTWKINRLSP